MQSRTRLFNWVQSRLLAKKPFQRTAQNEGNNNITYAAPSSLELSEIDDRYDVHDHRGLNVCSVRMCFKVQRRELTA
jgi:hypothetical protein